MGIGQAFVNTTLALVILSRLRLGGFGPSPSVPSEAGASIVPLAQDRSGPWSPAFASHGRQAP